MQIISSSNILNNPPPISNNPMGERIASITKDYLGVKNDIARKVWREEKFMDMVMTSLLCATLGVAALAAVQVCKMTKKSFLNATKFLSDKIGEAKTMVLNVYSKIFKK